MYLAVKKILYKLCTNLRSDFKKLIAPTSDFNIERDFKLSFILFYIIFVAYT